METVLSTDVGPSFLQLIACRFDIVRLSWIYPFFAPNALVRSSRFRHTKPVVLTGLVRALRILKNHEGLLVDRHSIRRRSPAWQTHMKSPDSYEIQVFIERHGVRRAFEEYREPLSSGGLRSGMHQSFSRAAATEAVVSAQERQI